MCLGAVLFYLKPLVSFAGVQLLSYLLLARQTQQQKFVNWQGDAEFRGKDFTAAVTFGNPDVLVGSGKTLKYIQEAIFHSFLLSFHSRMILWRLIIVLLAGFVSMSCFDFSITHCFSFGMKGEVFFSFLSLL